MKQCLRTLLIAVVLSGSAATSAYAGSYDALYVFGDSLSDAGNDLIITGGAVPASPPLQ